jgi:hypothetical protein
MKEIPTASLVIMGCRQKGEGEGRYSLRALSKEWL